MPRAAALGLLVLGTAAMLTALQPEPATPPADDGSPASPPPAAAEVEATLAAATPKVEATLAPTPEAATTPPAPSASLSSPPPAASPVPANALGPHCESRGGGRQRAAEMLAGRLVLPPFEAVPLPRDPTWRENPLEDRHWEFQYHSTRFVWDLLVEWQATGDARPRDLALSLLQDWVRDNEPGRGRSSFSWNDHTTALRALVLACVAETFPDQAWARDALATHGRILADPGFYVGHANHALNQNRGLLAAGCLLDRDEWVDLAAGRLAVLVRESVDDQGVTNEQAVFYQAYNLRAYQQAIERLTECGAPVPEDLRRVDAMPTFLAHATLPDGTYVSLGDTGRAPATRFPGTVADFAATGGAEGQPPDATYAIFDAGFLFSRTGWGTERPYPDEIAMSLRFGPGRQWHGHDDGGSVTLYGYGRRLLDDPGTLTLNFDEWRAYAVGRSAHNVVTVPGLAYDGSLPTSLLAATTSGTHDDTTVSNRGYPGIEYQRRVLFSHGLGYLLIEDRVTSPRERAFEQLWHLDVELEPVVDGTTVRTTADGGNVTILQLAGTPAIETVRGQEDPVQGWLSFRTGHRVPAPVVSATLTGRDVRYLTLVVPTRTRDEPVTVSDLRVDPEGWTVVVDVGGRRERVTATSEGSLVERL